MVKRIGDWRLEEELNREGTPVVVLFTASGGERGEEARLEFRKLARDFHPTRFFEVDLTENPSLASRFEIYRVPTAAVFIQGIERPRHAGPEMRSALRRALGHEPTPEPDTRAGIDD